jgi:XTP/dITP diphosphohydrolase
MPSLVVASRNRKKTREIADLLAPLGIAVSSAADFPDAPDVQETGTTFAENAALKASAVAGAIHQWALADDSGLAVDALHGAPGVYSARYAGPEATDRDNNARLLDQLRDVPDEQRGAEFICRMAVADPAGEIRVTSEGRCRGRVLRDPRGQGGFGYDPLFWIPEYHKTFAQLSLTTKSVLSHRARAFYHLLPKLRA